MFFKFDFGILNIAFLVMLFVGDKSIEEINFTVMGYSPTCEALIIAAVN